MKKKKKNFDNSDDFTFDEPFENDNSTFDEPQSFDDGFDTESTSNERIQLKISQLKIISALIGGLVGSLIGETVYSSLVQSLWTPLVIGVYFLILALCIFLSIFIASKFTGDFRRFYKVKNNKPILKFLPIVFVAIFLLSGIFEFIYELNPSIRNVEPTSYIFALDTSDSMNTTDESHETSKAVAKIVNQMEDGFPYTVYTFNSYINNIYPMQPKSGNTSGAEWDCEYENGTALTGVLDTILNDYQSAVNNGTWIGGDNPKVLVLTDGYPTDSGIFDINIKSKVKKFEKAGISVSTVSVADANVSLMEYIAKSTGGVNVSVNNVDDFYQTIQKAINSYSERTLFSYRPKGKYNGLFAFLRILFLTIISTLFCGIIYIPNAIQDDSALIFACKIVTALIGAILMELLLQIMGMSSTFARILFCLLTSFSLLHTKLKSKNSYDNSNNNENNNTGHNFDKDLKELSEFENTTKALENKSSNSDFF